MSSDSRLCGVEIGLTLALVVVFFFQAEDGIRDAQESRGLGDVYKRQMVETSASSPSTSPIISPRNRTMMRSLSDMTSCNSCLLYTSDAADDLLCVDLGGRRIIKKKI